MVTAFSQISWFAVSIATVAQFVLGGVWFTALFRNQYARALGIADRVPTTPGPMFILGPLFCGAVTVATTALLLRALAIADYADAMALGAIVGIGYLGAMTVTFPSTPFSRDRFSMPW